MHDRLAIIDLGTNTFHLLIAEKLGEVYRIVHRDRLAVKIGKGGINKNVITEDAIRRAVDALTNFKKKIDSLLIDRVYAFGTSALRNAENKEKVIQAIYNKTGISVNVISGELEAEFIYLGVRSALNVGERKSLIMDIGGGSVEFIIGNQSDIFWKQSFEIGAQRLLEKFHKSEPITDQEIISLDQYFRGSLEDLFDALQVHQPDTLIGSSGTFDTLSDIHCIREGIIKNDDDRETPLSLPGFRSIYSELITKNREQRLAISGMIEMRVDMIVVACCLIRFLLDKFEFTSIRVSNYALKEGALAYVSKVTG